MARKCKICKTELSGRADKVYCSINCKNAYYRMARVASKKVGNEITSYLNRNYLILSELMENRSTQKKVYRNVLEKKKFRFKYHTHFHINSKKKMFHYIYDLGWMEFSDDEVLIVRKKL